MRQTIVLINLCLIMCFQMGVYATLGVGQALAAFLNGTIIAVFVYSASRRMHDVCFQVPCVSLSNSWVECHHPRNAKSDVFF